MFKKIDEKKGFENFNQTLASYLGYLSHANAYDLSKSLLSLERKQPVRLPLDYARDRSGQAGGYYRKKSKADPAKIKRTEITVNTKDVLFPGGAGVICGMLACVGVGDNSAMGVGVVGIRVGAGVGAAGGVGVPVGTGVADGVADSATCDPDANTTNF